MSRGLDRDEYAAALILAHTFAQSIRRLPLEQMAAAIARAEAIAPIVDPTLFIKKGAALAQDGRVIQILADAKRQLDALPWPTPTEPDCRSFQVQGADWDLPGVPVSVERADRELVRHEGIDRGVEDGDASRVVFGQGVR